MYYAMFFERRRRKCWNSWSFKTTTLRNRCVYNYSTSFHIHYHFFTYYTRGSAFFRSKSPDCNIRIFDLTTLEEKKIFVAHTLSANCICYSPDGALILTGGRDAHLNIWDAKTYTRIKSIPAHNFAIYDIVFSPDAKLFATASRDKTIKIWDAETFELQVRINKENFEGHVNSVNKLIWTENYLLSTGDDRSVMVWEVNKEC